MSRLEKLLKILTVEPGDAFTLYGVAQEYAKRGGAGDAAQSIAFYDQCLAADPAYCYAYYHKAVVQADEGDTKGAIATARKGIEVARRALDQKALSELTTLVDSFT